MSKLEIDKETYLATPIALLVIIISIIGGFYQAYILMVLWNWFVPPAIGLPYLSFLHAVGLTLVTDMFLIGKKSVHEKGKLLETLLNIFLSPAILLLFGWVIHLYI